MCKAGAVVGVVAILFWMLICCSLCVPVCALICVAKACRDRTPIDLKIHIAQQKAYERLNNTRNGGYEDQQE